MGRLVVAYRIILCIATSVVNVGVETRGESQYDAESGERAVRDERLQEVLSRRVRQSHRVARRELR